MAKTIVRGDRQIQANMRRITRSVQGSFISKTVREEFQPMKEATESNARALRQVGYNPRGGHLDEGVVVAQVEKSPLHVEFWLTFRRRARKIAHLVEFGTAPHYQPRRGILHPGARPKPFFRPAYESTKDEVIEGVGRRVWAKISSSLIGSRR